MASKEYNQTPSSTASTSPPTIWDVFLSFRGIDTRFTFTDHLYNALDRNGIRTFRDDPELRSGELISDALLQAIQKSKTYVIVLSENYASSRWCLDELVEIMNCFNKMQRLVIPVFYNIEPSVVGHQTGSFQKAFEKYETRFDKERLHEWRFTLSTVGKLSGKVCKNMSEANVIDDIVAEILLEINPKTLDVAKYPVGLGPRVKELTALLSSVTEGVIRIGIYGMGGVGKTTLAKALYNQLLLRSFNGCCFLANVREVSGTTKGLESLQQQLLDDVLKSKTKLKVRNVEEGTMFIRERICSAKILVLIDDVDDLNQYESLVGPFASESVVIITTRDEEILENIEVEPRYRYRVNELDDVESLALFTQHAFGNANTDSTLNVLSKDILRLAGGLPLALKVFGSHLYKRSKVGWEAYVEKLQRNPNISIQQRLMISLDALESDDPMLKKIFLDISCFFIGWAVEKVVQILETYYSFADYYIDILKKRCLLTIDNQVLGMHDLLRDIGRKIARNDFPNEPGKHSRLWVLKEICDVLKNHKGTEAIEVIFHRILSLEYAFTTETFKRMRKLRFLHLTGVNLIGSFEQTLENLSWLCWEYCPLKFFPSEFHPQTLVVLELPCSNMIQLWESDIASQVFKKLKTLNMSNSQFLTITPDFTKLPSLETLNLEGCSSLEELNISIGSLERLVSLNLRFCLKLRSLPDTICNLRALEVLNIGQCTRLEAVPEELGNIESLKELNAIDASLSELPDSIGRLSKLVKLILTCHPKLIRVRKRDLKTLPDTICNLRALEVLSVGSRSLTAFPVELGNIESLKELDVEYALVSKIPDSIGRLSKLVRLRLYHNKNLKTLPHTIRHLRSVEILDIAYCSNLEELPVELGNIESMKELHAQGLAVSKLPDSIGRLSNLVKLILRGNTELKTLPDTICNLRSLEILDINNCSSLEALPAELGNIESLKELNVINLAVSILPDSIGRLSKLVELRLRANKNLKTLPGTIRYLRSVEILDIAFCSNLEAFPVELGNIESMKELHAQGLAVSKLPDSIGRLSKLVELILNGNTKLKTLPDTICNLRSLEILDIDNCSSLEALPAELGNIESLKKLHVKNIAVSILPDSIGRLSKLVDLRLSGNKNLKTLPSTICNMRSLEFLDISGCEKLEILPDQLWKITRLRKLVASGVTMLKGLPDIESSWIALSLEKLDLSYNVFPALPSGIGQLSNLEDFDLTGCGPLLSIAELPSNLKRIKTNGCKSMETLSSRDCSGLKEMHGLQELTSIRRLHLGGGCSSFLTKYLFQVYSGLEHSVTIYVPSAESPDWISQSPHWIQSNLPSTMSLDLPSNVSYNLLAMILCFKHSGNLKTSTYSIENTTSGFIRRENFFSNGHEAHTIIVILPISIFSVKGDDRIQLTADTEIIGIRLLYETEIKTVDDYDSTTVEERIHPSKTLKYMESDKNLLSLSRNG